MLKSIFTLITIIHIINCDFINDLTLFQLDKLPPQKVHGVFKTAGLLKGDPNIIGDCFIINDPINNRYLQHFHVIFPPTPEFPRTEVSTYWVILANASYTWGSLLRPRCLRINNYNYTNQVLNFGNLFSQPDSKFSKSTWSGLAKESATCDKFESMFIILRKNIINLLSLSINELVPLPNNITLCYNSKNMFEFEKDYDSGPFDNDFILPSGCFNNPDDYCSQNPVC